MWWRASGGKWRTRTYKTVSGPWWSLMIFWQQSIQLAFFSPATNYHEKNCSTKRLLSFLTNLITEILVTAFTLYFIHIYCMYLYMELAHAIPPRSDLYSILALSRPAWDLSGKAAATSSIFLNCQGNWEGYRKGRRSKPRGVWSVPLLPHSNLHHLRLSSGL